MNTTPKPDGEQRGVAQLLVEEPGFAPRVIALAADEEVRLGRAAFVEVSLDDRRVSRVHAVVSFDGRNEVVIRDASSRNGTFVGGTRIFGARRVSNGAVIGIGSLETMVRLTLRPTGESSPRGSSTGEDEMVAVDPVTLDLVALVRRIAWSDLAVVIHGEVGVGKTLVARLLHRHSPRARGPFITLDCATMRELLPTSGGDPEPRSFGATDEHRTGVFDEAIGGTLLLDEVGDLSPLGQALLVRALQGRVVAAEGSPRTVRPDVRIVATTRRELALDVAQGRFRQDLYYRLCGVTVQVPPLRSRREDIVPLAEQFLARVHPPGRLGPGVAQALEARSWAGNVGELQRVIAVGLETSDGPDLLLAHLPVALTAADRVAPPGAPAMGPPCSDETERQALVDALAGTGGNRSLAARNLGISRRCLTLRMRRWALLPTSAATARD